MKSISVMIVLALVFDSLAFAGQASPTPQTPQSQTQETPQSAKAKAQVQKRGIGEKSRVKVKLRDNTEVKGYISKIEETSFAVTDKKTGQVTAIPYADVDKIRGPGLSTAAKIGIGVAVGVGIAAVVLSLALRAALSG